ncbi:MAG: CvpA family protein [Dehalococcoidales bacterium]|nr:CvpA family protein [Dehalococcoidales bacterium]
MNWLDIILIIFLVISIVGGIASGLVRAIFSLAGLIIGVVLAGHFYSNLADALSFISNDKAAGIVAFAIIFIVVVIIAALLGTLFTKIVSSMMLGFINRLGGAVLGFFIGAIFLGAILAIWVKFLGENSVISNSVLASLLVERFPFVMGLLPEEFDMVRDFFQK